MLIQQAPAFKTPAMSKPSLLGLDKLAAEKRAQAAAVKMEPPSKRTKREADEDENGLSTSGGVFKGVSRSSLSLTWLTVSSRYPSEERSRACST